MLLTKAFSSGTLPKQQVYVHGEDEFLDADEAWLHEEAAEEGGQACSDAELIASQRRIIIDIGKQLGRKIMAGNLNLINITLPVVMFEPRSYLQKLADPWVHPVHLEAAAAAACPLRRLKLCVAWFVAGLQHVFSSWRKPFNPVLGETWQACLPSGSTMCCEQISHHPPVTAFHVEGPCGVFSFDGLSQPEVSFAGGGLKTSARGYRRITFASDAAVIEITYPYYRIGGLLSGVPQGLIKGTATLTDTKHNLTATVTFGPVAGATSRLLSRADSFEVIITGPAAAAGVADDVNDVIAVPAWVKQAVAEVAAKRAGCHVAVTAAAAAATDAPARPATAEAASAAAVAAATTAATTATAAAAAHNGLQCREAEGICKQTDVALTSSGVRSSGSESAFQETAGAVAPAAAATVEPVRSADSLFAALFSSKLAKRTNLQRSKSDTHGKGAGTRSAAAPQSKQQGFGSSCSSSKKDGSAGSSISTSKNGRRLAQFFVRASSTALRISSSSSTTCSSNSSSTQSLVKLEHSSSSSTGKSSSNSCGNGSGKHSSSSRIHRVFGPAACFMTSDADSRDASKHNGMFVSIAASSRRSSRGPQEGCCSATTAAAACEAAAEDLASSFNPVGGSCGGRSNHCVQCDVTRAEAAKVGGGEEDKAAAAAANCKLFEHAAIVVTAGTAASSSSKAWSPMQPLPPQQQQQCEQAAAASLVQQSSQSFSCKQQQQQQLIHRPGNSSGFGPRVQVLAVGNGCWLSHLDFEGQRYWTLVDDQPEIWQPQQQQQYVLPSDCQNRPDLVALRRGEVKLSQQLKEQMEQQQRTDAKMRPSFQQFDCHVDGGHV